MKSLNRLELIGNVGNDPEIIATNTGSRIAKLSLATNETWTDKQGQKQEKTQWHRLTVFGKLADVVEQWVKKGDRLYVEGRVEYSQTEHEGVTRYWTDVNVRDLIMLGGAGERTASAPAGAIEPEDDLPF